MVKCEMYEAGKTSFDPKNGLVCTIERGTCPYGSEGHRIECPDKIVRIMCNTNAEVDKTGLIKNLQL